MNKNIVIALTVIVLLLIGGGVFLMNRQSSSPASDQSTLSPQSPQNTTTATQTTSLKNLMASKGSQQCTFNDTEMGSSGTMYISGNKMRGDFSSTIDNRTTTSHMISEGENAYVWMDDQKSGFKVSLKSMEGLNAKVNTNAPQAVDINKQMDYQCSTWTVDASLFAAPTDVQFQDMSAMVENTGTTMEADSAATMPNKQEICAACDQAPAEAQAQCKAALNCN